MTIANPFSSRATLKTQSGDVTLYRLEALSKAGLGDLSKLPFSIKILLESCLRNCDGFQVTEADVARLAGWKPNDPKPAEAPFKPARVILQDFTGVPAVVDLAAMRSAMARAGGDPARINPLVPVDLVIDHSVQVDAFGSGMALETNIEREFERNRERYEFLKWGQKAFENFRVVPPSMGIVHQVNLEYLATVVVVRGGVAMPDSLVGTDSHTTMINGLGVLGWGVGGIEAEACMLGQPIYLVMPQVVGFKLKGKLPEGTTATDLVLVITQILRKHGVVEKFVEFFGPGLAAMTVADRATIANMAPEYGATMGFFPVDEQTLAYLRLTGRSAGQVDRVERFCKEQGLWRVDEAEPTFTEVLELDLSTVTASLAGPRRPQDRVDMPSVGSSFRAALVETFKKQVSGKRVDRLKRVAGEDASAEDASAEDASAENASAEDANGKGVNGEAGNAAGKAAGDGSAVAEVDGKSISMTHGDVVIAAITSCTNTSNPGVMLAAGLLAKKAVEKGLRVPAYVKTSLSPGSRVVTDYYERSGLGAYLDKLGFQTTGYGCMTCIGNSGPLPDAVAGAVEKGDLVAAAVLSGNRNFEGRINPHVKANYLASPPLVVAYALAGSVDVDLSSDPIGLTPAGEKVYLKDIWPTQAEVQAVLSSSIDAGMFQKEYGNVEDGNERWNDIPVKGGQLFAWDESSTYIQEPPFFTDLSARPKPIAAITGARVLAMVGDSVTTDHISPAGSIKKDGPAGRYLLEKGVGAADFNSYGSRRGNDRVMTRGTFANIRLKNQLAPGTEGGVTKYPPTGEVMSIYDASTRYRADGVALVVLAGKDYGMGSSRDWAAKGVYLLGVKAVIAESFERIHRSNLVGMGVLPLVYRRGETRASLGLDGTETFDIAIADDLRPGQEVAVRAAKADGSGVEFTTVCRIDTPVEIDYYRNGGILHTVLRKLLAGK